MSQALSSQRSWIARIAVLGMLASLLAFGAAPAGAAIDTSGSCPASIPDAGFTDLAGVPAAAVDAINCIAEYGISTGTTATTFDPFADVQRWQMALFLTRQAEIHGVSLPSGADQGFTDLGGVPAAAVTAINQTAQLGISTGTSATTFDPFADVERWQMALFLTRLINAAGITLPSGADQGFTDLAGVPAAAVTAINQLSQLDISDGTTATTYDPFGAVERWAMALFLARTLAADGITPPIVADFTFSPSGDLEIDSETDQQFTISGLIPGDDYQVALIDSDAVDTSGSSVVFDDDDPNNNEADDLGDEFNGSLAITRANGVNITDAAETTLEADSDGEVTVTVNSDTFESFYIIAFGDDDGDADLDLNAANQANEEFGLSGKISILAPEAPNGATGAVVVLQATDTYFVGDGIGSIWTFFYDTGDDLEYTGTNTSAANFKSWLTVDDEVSVTNYSQSAGSTFDIFVDIPNDVTGVTAVDGDFDETSGDTDDNDVRVTFDAATGGSIDDYLVWLFEDDADADTDCDTGVLYGTLFDSEDVTEGNAPGGRSVVFPNVPDDVYCAVVWAETDTGDFGASQDDTAAAVVTVDTGETSAPEIDDLDITSDTVTTGLLDSGDVLVFTFNETMAAALGSTNATFFRVTDDDSVYQIQCGGGATPGDATCVLSDFGTDTDNRLTVTLGAAPLHISGETNGVDLLDVPTVTQVSAAWDDLAGNQLSLAASTDVTID